MSELPDWQIEIDQGVVRWQADVDAADSLESLRSLEVRALGKAGEIPALMKRIPQIPPQDRKSFGQAVNALQGTVAAAIEARRLVLVEGLIDAELNDATFDAAVGAVPLKLGHPHPLSTVQCAWCRSTVASTHRYGPPLNR